MKLFFPVTILLGSSPNQSTVQKLRGISFENSQASHIFKNSLTKMGSGIYGLAACNSSKLECNTMTTCYDGCYFNNATTGNQILPGNINTNNQWISNAGPWKIEGSFSSTTTWYYDPNILVMNPLPASCLSFNTPQSGNANILCGQFGKLTDESDSLEEVRDELFSAIVSGENEYAENDDALKVWDEQFAYFMLSEDSALLNLGNDQDALYQNYFDSIAATNTGWIQKSVDYIDQSKFDSAQWANDHINPLNEIEINRKKVNEILLAYWQMEMPMLDSDQAAILEPIAYSDPTTGGEAVYTARVLLDIDTDEAVKYQLVEDDFTGDQEAWIKLYPNPASNSVNVLNTSDGSQTTLRLYSVTGLLIIRMNLEEQLTSVDVSMLKEGIYILQATTDVLPACHAKLMVRK
jgi:hypothetical protein